MIYQVGNQKSILILVLKEQLNLANIDDKKNKRNS